MEFKQGVVGDLNKLTNQELLYLLERQESILKNNRFVLRLPDKGEKIKLFKKKLEDAIKEREKVDETADMLEKMSLKPSKNFTDESKNDELSTSLKTVSKSPFKPFESLKSKSIPTDFQKPKMMSSSLKGNSPSTKSQAHSVVEYSNVVSPLGKSEKTIILPHEESQKLLVEQKEKYEDLQAKQAAARLAERLHLTIGEYEPQADDTYREVEEVSSEDEDETGVKADLSDLIEET